MRSQLAMDGDVDVATVFGYQYAYLRIFRLRLCSLNNTLLHPKFSENKVKISIEGIL